jgi:hypothetical protein
MMLVALINVDRPAPGKVCRLYGGIRAVADKAGVCNPNLGRWLKGGKTLSSKAISVRSAAERQRDYYDRQKKRGLVKTCVFVPKDKTEQPRRYAAGLVKKGRLK